MNPKRIHPRKRIKLHLEALSQLPTTYPQEVQHNVEGITHAVEELIDPPTLPEIAALSTKQAWWWEGFMLGIMLVVLVAGVVLILYGVKL